VEKPSTNKGKTTGNGRKIILLNGRNYNTSLTRRELTH